MGGIRVGQRSIPFAKKKRTPLERKDDIVMMKRLIICFMLVTSLLFSQTAFATDTVKNYVIADLSIREMPVVIEDNDFFITQEVAYYIAEFFIHDIVKNNLSRFWDSKTSIIRTEVMYGVNGEDITAYTFELANGYIVVSAYLDVPEIILEWSDETAPVYALFESAEDATVVYLGALSYFLDEGGEELKTIDATAVSRTEVYSVLDEIRSINNVREDLLEDIIEAKLSSIKTPGELSLFANGAGGEITDPLIHAKNVYGGNPWVAYEWRNDWESYTNFARTQDFNGTNHCGPVAITNIIKMYGKRYNNSTIKNASNSNVFQQVLQANINSGSAYYAIIGGTFPSSANNFIRDSFGMYNVSVSTYGQYACSYSGIKTTLDNGNRLLYITVGSILNQHSYYGYHAVVGYAYTRLYSSSLNAYKSYVKICDGWASGGRYIDLSTIASNNFWEVKCN
jgi:hypothetical protein